MVVLAVALVLLIVAFVLVVRYLCKRIDAAEAHARDADERATRAPALSRAVNLGKIGEQFAPLLPGFVYNIKDMQWVGGKVDAIVWNGLEAVKSGQGSPEDIEVVLLEIKTGKYARVDDDQRLIRAAVDAGRVRFDLYRFRPQPETWVTMIESVASPELILPDDGVECPSGDAEAD